MTDPLFKGRTPEAAARQLAIVLASATEMHLAILEWWQLRKSTPKSELKRQESICETLVAQCADLGIQSGVRGLRGTICGRLSERLSAANTEATKPPTAHSKSEYKQRVAQGDTTVQPPGATKP